MTATATTLDHPAPDAHAIAAIMPAYTQRAYGTVDVLTFDEIAVPSIAENEVLVRVHAAGVDRGTEHLLTGKPYLMRVMGFGFRRPKNLVPGLDLAGTVVAVGSAVTRFTVGDEVYGIGKGSFAGFSAAREDKLSPKPAGITFEQAAVVPVSASTALQALEDAGRIQSGQSVLILGASGGVGSFAIQIAKALGAEVTGVASTAKVDLVRQLGADHVIDYTREDATSGERTYDLILDIGGNTPVKRLRRILAPSGTVVFVGGESGDSISGSMGRPMRAMITAMRGSQRMVMLASKEHHDYLDRLAPMLVSGAVVPSIDQTYPLRRLPEAIARLRANQVRGKIAITI